MAELKVPGATIYYETKGTGPVLLCITGGPTDAGMFADLATRLSDAFTVVSYDQRGHSRSPLDAAPEDIAVSVHADDAAALIRELSDGPALVYGNSGGGTIGLELVTRHPELVRTFVAQSTAKRSPSRRPPNRRCSRGWAATSSASSRTRYSPSAATSPTSTR